MTRNSDASTIALDRESAPRRTVAVIDIGSASIRMAIAQISVDGDIQPIDSLQRSVFLGKETFTIGRIQQSTIEECVDVLISFRRVMLEYGIEDLSNIRAVATSAVREAINCDQFLDRIYSATRIIVDAIDEAEVNQLTYLMALPVVRRIPNLWDHATLITEIGGGSTELLLMEAGVVTFSDTYRLGSLRMREMLESSRAPAHRIKNVMQSHIQRTLDQIQHAIPETKGINMLVLGGDARFAAGRLRSDWNMADPISISVSKLSNLTDDILSHTVDELVQRFHVSFSEAESMGPALLSIVMLSRMLKLENIVVAGMTLRDGLLVEMAAQGSWTVDFRQQIVQSAIDLGHKFHFDENHARHVAELCRDMFLSLSDLHKLEPRYELLLYISALLHEIGLVISTRSHHKHSMYLIRYSDLFGLGNRDQILISLVARYHRRATPRPTHEEYASLSRESRILVSKLAALLRLADALDRAHSQRIRKVSYAVKRRQLLVTTSEVDDVTLERLALKEKGGLFAQIYGLSIELSARQGKAGE